MVSIPRTAMSFTGRPNIKLDSGKKSMRQGCRQSKNRAMSDEDKISKWPIPIGEPDESMPANTFRFEHPDGRIDLFMLVENEVVPIHLTKLGDPPNWACPLCSFINEQKDKSCSNCNFTSEETK